jgi:hypothetical protein
MIYNQSILLDMEVEGNNICIMNLIGKKKATLLHEKANYGLP